MRFYKKMIKKIAAMAIAAFAAAIAACSIDAGNENSGLALCDSATYIELSGNYYPVSFVKNGTQLLVGSFWAGEIEDLAEQMPAAESLKKNGAGQTFIDSIASNGDWEFFPVYAMHEKIGSRTQGQLYVRGIGHRRGRASGARRIQAGDERAEFLLCRI